VESFDITLVGRWLTVVRNGVKTIDNQEIAGTTAARSIPTKAAPARSTCRAIHTGGMKYRNITVQVPKQ